MGLITMAGSVGRIVFPLSISVLDEQGMLHDARDTHMALTTRSNRGGGLARFIRCGRGAQRGVHRWHPVLQHVGPLSVPTLPPIRDRLPRTHPLLTLTRPSPLLVFVHIFPPCTNNTLDL